MVSGFTQVVAVIGHPITQVKSPENFNRYFADQQMDSVMIPVDIAPEAVADYLKTLRGWQTRFGWRHSYTKTLSLPESTYALISRRVEEAKPKPDSAW